MNSREIRLKTRKFVKEFDIHGLTYGTLQRAVEQQGYTIIGYNHILNDENVSNLIDALDLSDYIARSRCFTYADQNYRIVFVHEDLSEQEKLLVLSHEAGHIFLGHMSSSSIIGKDVQEEYEANEFSHFLMRYASHKNAANWICKHKAIAFFAAVFLATLIAAAIVFPMTESEKHYYGDYYVTASGNKYHEKDCIFVKDKTNTHRMTVEEFESGDYEPCGICLP